MGNAPPGSTRWARNRASFPVAGNPSHRFFTDSSFIRHSASKNPIVVGILDLALNLRMRRRSVTSSEALIAGGLIRFRVPSEPVHLGARVSAGRRTHTALSKAGEPENDSMARHLFIVSKNHV